MSAVSDRAPLQAAKSTITESILVAVFNSFVVDYAARCAVGGTDLSYFIIKQLPIPHPDLFDECPFEDTTYKAFLVPRVLELVFTSWELASFAEELGCVGRSPFKWDEHRRLLLQCEIDAALFHLYNVNRTDLAYIMDTFPIVRKEDRDRWGEYRTKRLILERYDAMAEASFSNRPYETILDPPPAHPSVTYDESTRPHWAPG